MLGTPLHRASTGLPLRLGRELGRGGEGAVYALENAPNLVAKIYLKAPLPAKAEKLRGMVRRATAQLLRVAAWPMDLLLDQNGVAIGFLMRKVSAREDIHELYSPKSRRQKFSTVDFRFVVRVATNLSRAFAQVHALGNVIGDVNHGNALVGRDGTVVLIDCDSIQIRDGSRIHTCDVGVPLFTPPELQGRAFRALRRTADHDAFGLAVLIFHLLYLGRHPFAGRSEEGDIPIERAIAESRFVFGAKSAEYGMTAPPGTLPLHTFGARIAALFERSFAAPGEARRTAATEWIEALQELEQDLVKCVDSDIHYHRRGESCCWCEIESRTGLRFFGPQIVNADSLAAANVDALWDAIRGVPAPDHAPPLPAPRTMPSGRIFRPVTATKRESRWKKYSRILFAWVLGCLAAMTLFIDLPRSWAISLLLLAAALHFGKPRFLRKTPALQLLEIDRDLLYAEVRWKSLLERWHRECSDESFNRAFNQLSVARGQLLELPERRAGQLHELSQRREAEWREQYLSLYRIDGTTLPGLRIEDIENLAALGLATAADILRPEKMQRALRRRNKLSPGCGLTLRAWAEAHAAVIRSVPPPAIKAEDVKRIDDAIETQRDLLLTTLRGGPSVLQAFSERIEKARAHWGPQLDAAWADLCEARERAM